MKHLILLVTAAMAFIIHSFFGWSFSIVAAIVAGAWYKTRPVAGGMATLVLSWGTMMAYTSITAPRETANMLEIMGSLFGDLPGFVIVLVALMIAAVLGGIGGWIGAASTRMTTEGKQSN